MKKFFKVAFLIMLIVTLIQINSVYALYKNTLDGKYETKIGTWEINVNGNLITNGETETIQIEDKNFKYIVSNTVLENKVAPSSKVCFYLIINPLNTNVSIRYDLNFVTDATQDVKIKINSIDNYYVESSSITDAPDLTSTLNTNVKAQSNNTKYSGVFDYSKIIDGYYNVLRINAEWENNETKNVNDTELSKTENAKISIPVEFEAKQYTGETL